MSDYTLAPGALELLAPAKDADTGIAAIDHGADAVYIGGPAFGARQAAGNSLEDIRRLCEYAHRFHARVFMALNTLFTDDEIEGARSLAFDAAKAGVDVLIIQDMGLLAGPLPDIEIHASTQCDIRDPEKAAFLEKVGFSQIVVARELDLTQIRACRDALTHTRIEYFVHGALCVSYSGQCFMSQASVGRSANRGACAQLCRLPYDVMTDDGRVLAEHAHVLSLKDNNQSANLEALIDAGVSSFKIEGRLKDINYVKNITAYYRKALDAIIARRPELTRSSDGITRTLFTPDPRKTFNRGSTDYFVHGRQYDKPYKLAALESPKNIGTPAAVVRRVEPGRVTVKVNPGVTINNGDGLTYLAANGELKGLSVNRAEPAGRGLTTLILRDRHLPEDLKSGRELLRNRDRAFNRLLDGDSAERRIPVTAVFSVEDDALSLMLSCGKACGEATVALPLQSPGNPERNRATLIGNLMKLGDTPFSLDPQDIYVPDPLEAFVPASIANDLRRTAAAELLAAREAVRMRPGRAAADAHCAYPTKVLDYRANVANKKAKAFYAAHGAVVTEPAYEITPKKDADLMTCRHCVRASLERCPKMLAGQPALAERYPREDFRPSDLILVNSAGQQYRATFHCRARPCFMSITENSK